MKNKYINQLPATAYKQQGIALLTIMIFLLILTVIGLSSMETSRLEQQMSGNTQWTNIAFQAAETGLIQSSKDTSWAAEVNPSSVPSASATTGNTNSGYSRYFVDFSPSKRQVSNAWSAKSSRRANFKSAATGKAMESSATLATVQLEEGIYLVVPKI